MKMKKATLKDIRRQITRVQAAGGFYAKRLKGIDPEDIRNIKVDMTILDGKVVFTRG